MKTAPETARSRDVKNRWLLSLPALAIIFVAALGPLLVMVLYSFLEKGDYGDVKFGVFSLEGWTSLDFRLVEAGYDLYANRLQVLWRIVIPLVKPGLIAGSILVFIPSLGAYVIPRVLGGGKNLMLGNLIELQFGAGRNWPLGAAMSITLMALVMIALLFYPGFGTIALFTFFALYLPIATLVAYSFNASDSLSSWGGFSLRWFASALENRTVQAAAMRSVIIALWAAGL
ncbi:hypothetical protein A4X03_0g9609, partial [Tilletia caries]